MPRTKCPSGETCINYSADMMSGPEMDGCVGECQRFAASQLRTMDSLYRGEAAQFAHLLRALTEAGFTRDEAIKIICAREGRPT